VTSRPIRTSGVLGAVAVGVALLAAKSKLADPPPPLSSLSAGAVRAGGPTTTSSPPVAPTATPTMAAPTEPGTGGFAAAPQSASTATPASAPTSTPASMPSGPRVVEGDRIDSEYGPMQVALVLDGGRIVDIRHLAIPENDAESIEINRTAVPELHRQALAAQGSDIQGVSGATYTSQAYALSVQSALDRS
jgi:uncharacterized protein with FMN-binding domain